MRKRILLVEDEPGLRLTLSGRLASEGHLVEQAADGETGLRRASTEPFDLVVLDVMLPDRSGFDVCRDLRKGGIDTPVLMLTARGQVEDRVLGLKLGADDYITKPFSIREFRSRVRALLRRAGTAQRGRGADAAIEVAGLRVDSDRREVRLDGRVVELTYVEFELLRTLAATPGRVFSRRALLEAVWGDAAYREPRTIDVHVRHLREKLESDPSDPDLILTVRGAGYRFREP